MIAIKLSDLMAQLSESINPDVLTPRWDETVPTVSDTPALYLLARHAYRLLFEDSDYNQFAAWPWRAMLPENRRLHFEAISQIGKAKNDIEEMIIT